MQFLNLGILVLLSSTVGAVLLAQAPQPEPYTFLRKQLAFSSSDLAALETNQIVVKLPKTKETREVAVFAISRIDVPADFLVESMRDIVTFKKSENVLQIGKFSDPPQLEDLAGLTLDQVDLDALKRCRAKSCDVKVSAKFMERLRAEVDWSASTYREQVTKLVREMLLERVRAYLHGGNAALGEYNDRGYALKLSEEFPALLKAAPYMYDHSPEFPRYLESFPRVRLEGAESFVYWSKEIFGLKPVINLTHVTIYKEPHGKKAIVTIGAKGIYASHYFEGSVGLTSFAQSADSEPRRSYLIYVNRTNSDALRGLLGGLKRSMINGSLRDGTRKNMLMIKQRLENGFQKSSNQTSP